MWHPHAAQIGGTSAGAVDNVFPRGVLHSTEGPSIAGAVAAYRASNSWPTFTIQPGGLAQHLPIGQAARALYRGGVPTNTITAVQIEICGYATESPNWPRSYLDEIAELMRWCEQAAGIPRSCSVEFVPYPDSYGENARQRMPDASWLTYTGWCGHEHVPSGNDHGDPGAIDIAYLLGSVSVPTPVPEPEEEETMPILGPPPKEYSWANLKAQPVYIKSTIGGANKVTVWAHKPGEDAGTPLVNPDTFVIRDYGYVKVDHPGGALQVSATEPVLAGPEEPR